MHWLGKCELCCENSNTNRRKENLIIYVIIHNNVRVRAQMQATLNESLKCEQIKLEITKRPHHC